MSKVVRYLQEVEEEMQKRGFTRGDAEHFAQMLARDIKENNERIENQKPFIVCNNQAL